MRLPAAGVHRTSKSIHACPALTKEARLQLRDVQLGDFGDAVAGQQQLLQGGAVRKAAKLRQLVVLQIEAQQLPAGRQVADARDLLARRIHMRDELWRFAAWVQSGDKGWAEHLSPIYTEAVSDLWSNQTVSYALP